MVVIFMIIPYTSMELKLSQKVRKFKIVIFDNKKHNWILYDSNIYA